MSAPSSTTIARAYAARDELYEAVRLLAAARKAIDTDNGHEAEDGADGAHPLDAISDASAAVKAHIDAIDSWLNKHDREAA